ncbi:palmitoyltransferase ZDHHC6 [Nilaparvata lugens]|uniref:palmitoyltransferase ZDHHC6 n=1 Tax=Nilaparvata lugens TaxID=108931 RepID=UPI00193D02F2|nr:palmitoyltransferase ZDHHC6 [Nilaparvata lugens]
MCVGPVKRLCHWGPLAALGITKLVMYATISCCSMWWPPDSSIGGFVNMAVFLAGCMLIIYNFLSAIFEGPGFLPLKWAPENARDEVHLQYCKICEGFKAPRSHHCRRCGRCVLKMDHHCPWINNCVGHVNHGHFTAFLLFSVLTCVQSTVILSCSLYRAIHRAYYIYHGIEPIIHFSLIMLIVCVFALGLSFGVVLAVGMLLYFQIRAIARNRTGIEDWILEKAIHRRTENEPPFIYPYDLGWKDNCMQVFGSCFDPVGDGITWKVRDGCHQYTLTLEQRSQKQEKRLRTRAYSVVRGYSGRWLPLVHGWRVLTHPPFTDEPRIPLRVGETVLVTRWRRYWLFGERSPPTGKNDRGWFPRCCCVDMTVPPPEPLHLKKQL